MTNFDEFIGQYESEDSNKIFEWTPNLNEDLTNALKIVAAATTNKTTDYGYYDAITDDEIEVAIATNKAAYAANPKNYKPLRYPGDLGDRMSLTGLLIENKAGEWVDLATYDRDADV